MSAPERHRHAYAHREKALELVSAKGAFEPVRWLPSTDIHRL